MKLRIIRTHCLAIPKLQRSVYASSLTSKSYKCTRFLCQLDAFCEILKIHILETGSYTILSNNTLPLYGYVYDNDFTLFDLLENSIASEHSEKCNNQLKFSWQRQMNTSFVLVVSTGEGFKPEQFSISISGPSKVAMQRLSAFLF